MPFAKSLISKHGTSHKLPEFQVGGLYLQCSGLKSNGSILWEGLSRWQSTPWGVYPKEKMVIHWYDIHGLFCCCQKYSWQIHVDKIKNTWANRTSFQNQYNIKMLEDDPNIYVLRRNWNTLFFKWKYIFFFKKNQRIKTCKYILLRSTSYDDII